MNFRGVGILAVLGLATLAFWLSGPSSQNDGVRIGFVTTLTTGTGVIGADMRDAFELALDHMGRTMGGLSVSVLYEDDAVDPNIGRQVTERLVQRDNVHFVSGFIWSNVLLASYQAATDNDVFLIGANAGPSQLAGEACNRNFFSTSWQNDQTTMAMGEVLNDQVSNLYVMAPNYAAGRNMIAGVERTFQGQIVDKALTQFPDQLDFAAELANIRAAAPEAVWVFYPGNFGTQFFQQYSQAGLLGEIPLYSTFSIDALNLPLIGELVEGTQMTQSWSPDMDNPANQKFVADFRAKYGRYPSFYAAQAYDAAMLIRSAVEAVEGDLDDLDGLRQALARADFDSVRGSFSFGENHFPIQDFFLREVVRDGDGVFTTRIVDVVYSDHVDPYAKDCTMQQ
jgi:branched-chain amino acid transport system substrate-binding protein